MSNSLDIRGMLDGWPVDPSHEVRMVRGDDGREILQVRLPLGLQQCETTGRPDGRRPRGRESFLEYFYNRITRALARKRKQGTQLNSSECYELFEEAALYNMRSHWLGQLHEWRRAATDLQHVLRILDLVNRYAANANDRAGMELYRVFFLGRETEALARHAVSCKHYDEALDVLRDGIHRISAMPETYEQPFDSERKRVLAALRRLLADIQKKRPISEIERLERRLKRAIKEQAFEQAAQLRDRIRLLRKAARKGGAGPSQKSAGIP